MPLQVCCETSIIFSARSFHSKRQHRRHHQTTERLRRQRCPPFQRQALVQDHQPLPCLLQRPPRLRHPVPAPPTTAADSALSPAISENRRDLSSCTASDVLRLMDGLQLPVEADTYAALLQECAISGDFLEGSAVHAHIRRRFTAGRSLLRQPAGLGLANRLLFMYAACRETKIARQLFDQMPLTDSISRVIIMTALSDDDDHLGSLRLFAGMHPGREDWWLVDPLGFRVVLWACVRAGELGLGRQLHGLAVKLAGCSSFADHSAPLIDFYAMLDCPDSSLRLMMASPDDGFDAAAGASVVSAYGRGGCFRSSLMIFREMERRGGRSVGGYRRRKRRRCKILTSVLAACAGANEEKDGFEGGRQVHAIAVKNGVDGDPYVGCGLVELYSKQGLLVEARRAFDAVEGCRRDAACWNAMLGGYARGGGDAEKVLFLREMKAAGMKPHEAILNQVW